MKYVWLYLCQVEYAMYQSLLAAFKTLEKLYTYSTMPSDFLSVLLVNHILLPYELYCNLTSQKLKEDADNMMTFLSKQQVQLLAISSPNYPISLRQIENPPIVLFAIGKLALLTLPRILYLSNSKLSKEGEYIYNVFLNVKHYDICIVSNTITKYENIIYLPYLVCDGIQLKQDVLYLSDRLFYTKEYRYEVLAGLACALFIPESEYNIRLLSITDSMLEQGKDIFVVPGSIYLKEKYLSNYLIKQGAICTTNKYEFIRQIK